MLIQKIYVSALTVFNYIIYFIYFRHFILCRGRGDLEHFGGGRTLEPRPY